MSDRQARGRRGARIALGATLVVAAVLGWELFWFLTDDAYIAFRYVSNAMAGRGLVWNPPPFAPVEGYTSFLWVVLLWGVWALAGLDPPRAANVLSLGFGLATLLLVYRAALRAPLPARWVRWRLPLAGLVGLGIVTNRTFLAWLSSGLETALFNFTVTAWVLLAAARPERFGARRTAAFAAAAAAIALTRPDGLLFVAATGAVLAAVSWARAEAPRAVARRAAWAAPLLAVPAHLLWRHAAYGAWLPNTYYAKYLGPWPEAGWRYAASFALEYGLWVWLPLVAAAGVSAWRRGPPPLARWLPGALAVAALAAHAAYYTLVIGGDHFEYRVYSGLVPLLFLSALLAAARLPWRPAAAAGALAVFVLASWPIPWVHWAETRGLRTAAETQQLVRPVAERFPAPLRPVVRAWDGWQAWLIRHLVCVRHQEHRVLTLEQARLWPPRVVGARVGWDGHPVLPARVVGMVSWVYPNVAVLDLFGLNDRVVARSPLPPGERLMAHARVPPPGYVECFRPNARFQAGRLRFVPRDRPLTDAEIRDCEARDWLGPPSGAAP